jgi:hypothetical protein
MKVSIFIVVSEFDAYTVFKLLVKGEDKHQYRRYELKSEIFNLGILQRLIVFFFLHLSSNVTEIFWMVSDSVLFDLPLYLSSSLKVFFFGWGWVLVYVWSMEPAKDILT